MEKQLPIIIIIIIIICTVPWLTRLVTLQRSGFGSILIQVGFLVDKVELGQVPASVLRFFRQCHSINNPYPFLQMSPTLLNLSN